MEQHPSGSFHHRKASHTPSPGAKRHKWTEHEDSQLIAAVQKHGVGNWRLVADEIGISSCSSKSCCQRWKSKHQPNLITEPFSDLEDAIIIAALQERGQLRAPGKGPRAKQGGSIPWVDITRHLRRRERIRHDNMVKNHWNGSLSTCYHNGSLRTVFVHRQSVLAPLHALTALLQAQGSPGAGQTAAQGMAEMGAAGMENRRPQENLATSQVAYRRPGPAHLGPGPCPNAHWASRPDWAPLEVLPSTVLRSLHTPAHAQLHQTSIEEPTANGHPAVQQRTLGCKRLQKSWSWELARLRDTQRREGFVVCQAEDSLPLGIQLLSARPCPPQPYHPACRANCAHDVTNHKTEAGSNVVYRGAVVTTSMVLTADRSPAAQLSPAENPGRHICDRLQGPKQQSAESRQTPLQVFDGVVQSVRAS